LLYSRSISGSHIGVHAGVEGLLLHLGARLNDWGRLSDAFPAYLLSLTILSLLCVVYCIRAKYPDAVFQSKSYHAHHSHQKVISSTLAPCALQQCFRSAVLAAPLRNTLEAHSCEVETEREWCLAGAKRASAGGSLHVWRGTPRSGSASIGRLFDDDL
jgi:hypothetical protein